MFGVECVQIFCVIRTGESHAIQPQSDDPLPAAIAPFNMSPHTKY